MITTNSFNNTITSSPKEDIKRNSLTKEDLEGEIKRDNFEYPNKNGGSYQIIKI